MKRILLESAGLVAALMFSLAAHASANASAALSDFNARLIDLAPDDGVEPWAVFAEFETYPPTCASTNSCPPGISGGLNYSAFGGIGSIEGDFITSPITFSVSARSTGEGDSHSGVNLSAPLPFYLSPNTGVIFTGEAHCSSSTSDDPNDFNFALCYIQLGTSNVDGDPLQSDSSAAGTFVDTLYGSSSRDATVTVAFFNRSAGNLGGYLTGQVEAWAISTLPAVPEPLSCVYLLEGVGALLLALRLKRVRVQESATWPARS